MHAFGPHVGDSKDRRVEALNFMLEAWDEALATGIAPELLAYAAIYTALTDLVAAFGEDAVASLASGLAARVRRGEFSLQRGRRLA